MKCDSFVRVDVEVERSKSRSILDQFQDLGHSGSQLGAVGHFRSAEQRELWRTIRFAVCHELCEEVDMPRLRGRSQRIEHVFNRLRNRELRLLRFASPTP